MTAWYRKFEVFANEVTILDRMATKEMEILKDLGNRTVSPEISNLYLGSVLCLHTRHPYVKNVTHVF